MCGIAGIFGTNDLNGINPMVDAQIHRGPDDRGVYIDREFGIALGSCRLAIIDLSAHAHMPFSTADGKVWIVYNGEVYNFHSIRAELEKLGYKFISHSDTEVVLNAYLQWGEKCLSRFRGMFAFAIYDNRMEKRSGNKGKLFLARDRLGIKPLYYAQVGGTFAFASEMKGLMASGIISRKINLQAVWDYQSFGSVPLPQAILADAKVLLPGHYMVVCDNQVEEKKYWDLVEATSEQRANPIENIEEASERLSYLLDDVIKMHSVADVPVGAFLSGGLDSSIIVALMSKHVLAPVKTFSVHFENQQDFNGELSWAKLIADRFATDHNEIVIGGAQIFNDFDRIIMAINQPSADGINSYYVSQAASSEVKVAMSGLGADEIFGGYRHFKRWAEASKISASCLRWFLPIMNSKIIHYLMNHLKCPPEMIDTLRCSSLSPDERYLTMRGTTNKTETINKNVQKKITPELISKMVKTWTNKSLDSISQTTYMEVKGYLVHTLLRDTDAMSMAHSLEVRVPFLDHCLVEFAFSLPSEMKVKGNANKRVLRESASKLIPKEILTRGKLGFLVPWSGMVPKQFCHLGQQLFLGSVAKELFSKAYINRTIDELNNHKSLSSHLANIVLLAWIEQNKLIL